MRQWIIGVFAFVCVAIIATAIVIRHSMYVPDLPVQEAASLISRAPEFNRYARLIGMDGDIFHLKNSMNGMSQGEFTFRYKDAPPDAAPIQANADFCYWGGRWHITEFDYGCAPGRINCQTVHVYNAPASN